MSLLFKIKTILSYVARAQTHHSLHSPFLFELSQEILEDGRHYYAFDSIANLKSRLKKDTTRIQLTDFGAGSRVVQEKQRTIGSILKGSASPTYYGRILFKLVAWLKPNTILELGTSLGMGTLFMAAAASKSANIITIEGDPTIAKLAKAHFQAIAPLPIDLREGEFVSQLSLALKDLKTLDMAFIDGNHRKEPTLAYFEEMKPFLHANSVLVFDDIHWSEGMEAAWQTIQADPMVTCTVDLYKMGLVFFHDKMHEKTHTTLIKSTWKPWDMGFRLR